MWRVTRVCDYRVHNKALEALKTVYVPSDGRFTEALVTNNGMKVPQGIIQIKNSVLSIKII